MSGTTFNAAPEIAFWNPSGQHFTPNRVEPRAVGDLPV
jgi:hypothetical protein